MRISGLASGIDTETMVKQLMQAERIPLDKLKQNKQTLEWKRDDYRSINTRLSTFRQDVLNMKLSSSYRARTTSSTNEAAVTATATSAASATSYQLSNIKLAKAASLTTNGKLSGATKLDSSKSLESMSLGTAIAWEDGVIDTQKFTMKGSSIDLKLSDTVKVQGDQVQIKVAGKVLERLSADGTPNYSIGTNGIITFEKNIPAAGSAVEVTYVTDKKAETLSVGKDAASIQLSKSLITKGSLSLRIGNETVTVDPEGKFSFENHALSGTVNFDTGKIEFVPAATEEVEIEAVYSKKYETMTMKTNTSNGEVSETFFISSDQSLDAVINKVNSSKLGLTMFYDSHTDQISVMRKETGSFSGKDAKDINILDSPLAQALQLTATTYTAGANAEVTINGLKTERASNTFTMNGVTFNLKSEYTGNVTIGINNDTSKVYDNIKGFIDKYNELISTIQGKVSEERNRNYLPLTDDERDSLSEDEIEKWEKIAKAGHLKNDSILTGVLNNMRSSFSNPVSSSTGLYKQLSSIGITTTSDYLAGGKLEINETKLKQALEEDPESVEALFTSEDGIMSKLQTNLSAATDQLKARAGTSLSTNATFTIGRDLTNIEDRISRFEDRLLQVEDRYYKQFTAMEKAIQKANSQSGYLSSMFTTGS